MSVGSYFSKVFNNLKHLSWKGWIKLILAGLLITIFITVVILCLIPDSPVLGWIFDVLNWISELPDWLSYILMIEVYGFLIPFGAPITPLNLVAGFLFGWLWGSVVGIVGAMLGATICYFWSITLLHDWAVKQLNSKRIFKAVHQAVQKNSIKLIILTRISPILPSPMLNYLFGTMGVGYIKYSLSSLVGIIPLLVIYVYIGSLANDLASAFNDGASGLGQKLVYIGVAIITSIFIIVVVTYYLKKEINIAMKQLDDNIEVVYEDDIEEEEPDDFFYNNETTPIILDDSTPRKFYN
eukprot:TRINITY_DN454_c5_g1_i1.p1 TRINITY_DN454_c5_g1~~TRINITY_DN454_c5_g1_i1.p1  ORF type:complete len:296 (+),score=49.34 TRINITY_DN454_c5_g1_i1:128-1015(+)